MQIIYKNKKIKKVCTNFNDAKKAYPKKIAICLHKVVNFIEAADSLKEIQNFKSYHFHGLLGNKKGQYAIDVGTRSDGYRLIVTFKESDDVVFSKSVEITEICFEEMGKHYG